MAPTPGAAAYQSRRDEQCPGGLHFSSLQRKTENSTDGLVISLQWRPSVVPFTPARRPWTTLFLAPCPALEVRGTARAPGPTAFRVACLQRKVLPIGRSGRKPEPREGNVAKEDGLPGRLEADLGQVPCRILLVHFTQPCCSARPSRDS